MLHSELNSIENSASQSIVHTFVSVRLVCIAQFSLCFIMCRSFKIVAMLMSVGMFVNQPVHLPHESLQYPSHLQFTYTRWCHLQHRPKHISPDNQHALWLSSLYRGSTPRWPLGSNFVHMCTVSVGKFCSRPDITNKNCPTTIGILCNWLGSLVYRLWQPEPQYLQLLFSFTSVQSVIFAALCCRAG